MIENVLERPATTTTEPETDVGSDTRQFVVFAVGEEVFAVDMAPVQEIIRVPDIVRVPLAPASLDGLSNLRGKVLPIVSLRRIFGFAEKAADDATRAVVIDIGQPLGFVVDRVASVINVEPTHIEGVEEIRGAIDSDLLTGILKDAGGFPMVMVLDFSRLIAREFAAIAALAKSAAGLTATADVRSESEEEAASDELQLVSFSVEGQEYAVEIERVQEIVQVPETVIHVPNAPASVLGLMNLRDRLLPLVSLRSLFALPPRALDEKSRIVVISLGAAAVGVVTDSVSEVLRVPRQTVEAMPTLLAREGNMGDIGQMCRLDGGKRLVSIIAVDHMFAHTAVKEALKTVNKESDEDRQEAADIEVDDDEQVVVFQLAAGEFGVAIESVQEIVRVPEELTHVPKAPAFVEGVINLRGAVLPVIDQRKRLDLPPIERNERQRIMVFVLDGMRTGFIVDAVIEVLKIPKDAIEPSPKLSSEQARLLGRVANLEKQKRMIQLIDPMHLVDEADRVQLAELG
ncbi:chemotaxis protein CheW [Burkholderia multivorans]|uniref:chemotaxis protein CheW n=1 Tax=Burkholderia multivorans TaxID=87883 RepID=UPI00286253B4|nr:chemotaxis protein CheW [Burkholderia multivorans]MDR9096154.1 Chemotaxis protein CheW [Burkholderia multivorans]MDR9119927.1 Chemotaxis protein CheW [Burkholderia multivorans]MDR9160194.1 Chemotaxis protein CheW [Burkholderia multivorans]MDR9166739.1 Chemotaxis protein CheW [Burkholderia multivorans]MDR9253218.1 Chemotaxis protein CheW [Burkholderia multivorans]